MENFDLEEFKNYVNTYGNQKGHEKYSEEIIIDDFLYGIGICLNEKFKYIDGYERFKSKLMEHLNASDTLNRSKTKEDKKVFDKYFDKYFDQ